MQDGNYVQCHNCGRVYYTKDSFSEEDFIVESKCPTCQDTKGINCGKNKEDIYLFYDNTKDPIFYLY